MVARINTVAFQGIDVQPVDVQVHLGAGLPSFSVVGLANKAVSEARERVRSALSALGLALPPKRITVNLAPADTLKEGSHYDLAIALGLLAVMDVVPEDALANYVVLGELSLDGRVTPVAGVLPAAIYASSRDLGLICPGAQGPEAAWAGDIGILAPLNLVELVNHFKGTQILSAPVAGDAAHARDGATVNGGPDLSDIKGQESAKRALEIAAAGGHSLLMCGPPGCGKSLLAATLPTILPPMEAAEALETSQIHSLAGTLPEGGLVSTRPFRSPHHTASQAALVGGGAKAAPGEVSLAHRGVLFLDELAEFSRSALDALRQPVETGVVSIARVRAHVTYPARFQLIAAMNPCRCGHLENARLACTRAPVCAEDYLNRISGPMLDRFDLFIEVPEVPPGDLTAPRPSESSKAVATRVLEVRERQRARFSEMGLDLQTNAEADGAILDEISRLSDGARTLLSQTATNLGLSARAFNRMQRVARTVADLDDSADVERLHMAEALACRRHRPGQNLMKGRVEGAA